MYRGMVFDFSNKTALVTGAAGTLGAEVTKQLAEAGATVLAVDRDADGVQRLADELRTGGHAVVPYVADVRSPEAVEAFAEAARALGGGIDLFFNNAGIEGAVAPIENIDITDVQRVFDINVIGVLLGLKHVLPRMKAGGVIVNTGSTASLRGAAGTGAYVASKHAVLGLTRTAAIEAAVRNIRVNAVCPGPIEGPMMDSLDRQRKSVFSLATDPKIGRTYSAPTSVAAAVLFLLSDASSLVNGEALIVEAGQ